MNLHLLSSSQDHPDLDYLLDVSDIPQSQSYQLSIEFSVSKDKLNQSQKERTRDQSYEDVCKQINQAKLEQLQLSQQLQRLKQNTYNIYLGPFRQEFQQLNQQNLGLRAQLRHYRRINNEDKSQRLSNRSSLKPRASRNKVYGDENAKTHTKAARKQASPNFILRKKQIKVTQSSTNLGKSQIVSPRVHRRRESLLTERRIQENNSQGVLVTASYHEEPNQAANENQIVKHKNPKKQVAKQNIFVDILQKILAQQKIRDNQKYRQLYIQADEARPIQLQQQHVTLLNEMQEEIQSTNQKLQMLTIVINKYQSEIKGMNVSLKNIEELTKKLYSVKGRFVEMDKRCQELVSLRKELAQRQVFLNSRKNQLINEGGGTAHQNIASVEAMVKIIANNPSKSFKCNPQSLYFNYWIDIKAIFKENSEEQGRRSTKMVKVRQMIEGIRQGRKKFNELIQIYEGRISKLQEKIAKARGQYLMKSDKSTRK